MQATGQQLVPLMTMLNVPIKRFLAVTYTVDMYGQTTVVARDFDGMDEAIAYGYEKPPRFGFYEVFDNGTKVYRAEWKSAPYLATGWDYVPRKVEIGV